MPFQNWTNPPVNKIKSSWKVLVYHSHQLLLLNLPIPRMKNSNKGLKNMITAKIPTSRWLRRAQDQKPILLGLVSIQTTLHSNILISLKLKMLLVKRIFKIMAIRLLSGLKHRNFSIILFRQRMSMIIKDWMILEYISMIIT